LTLNRWLAPRLLALHALAVSVIAGCVLMGLWQLGVYGDKHDESLAAVRNAKPIELLKVWGPDQPFRADLLGRRVRVHVRVDPGHSVAPFTVTRPDGEQWIAAPAPVEGTHSALLVVLGHVPKVQLVDLGPMPQVFTAVLQPSEPTGELSVAHRVNDLHTDLFSGYALLEAPVTTGLRPVDSPDPHVSWAVGLRNLAYALQWWVFGLFSGFMWWRMANDLVDVEGRLNMADSLTR